MASLLQFSMQDFLPFLPYALLMVWFFSHFLNIKCLDELIAGLEMCYVEMEGSCELSTSCKTTSFSCQPQHISNITSATNVLVGPVRAMAGEGASQTYTLFWLQ